MPNPPATVEALAARVAEPGVEADRLDGLTVDHGSWWYNVRPSNTEPLLRLNVEAPTEAECAQRVKEVLAIIEEVKQ